MKKLNTPVKSVADVLEIIISDGVSASIMLDIESAQQILVEREALYKQKIMDNTLYEIPHEQIISPRVDGTKIISYYKYRLLQRPNGRKFYDEIILSTPYDICPYCTVHIVKTLDHFLPKSEYPSYSITPTNLIPCCRDCNTEKKISFPRNPNDQTFHPYFDAVDTDRWIRAQLMNSTPLSFQYKVVQPEHWDKNKYNRALSHFVSYNINQLFSNEANRELRGMQSHLKKLFSKDSNLLKEHINETYNTCNDNLGLLDWKTLMYYELLSNNWFLEGCEGNVFFE